MYAACTCKQALLHLRTPGSFVAGRIGLLFRSCVSIRALSWRAWRTGQLVQDGRTRGLPGANALGTRPSARAATHFDVVEELREMESQLKSANERYYNGALENLMDDAAYDDLKRRYRNKLSEAEKAGINTKDLKEILFEVGATPPAGAKTCRHSAEHGGPLLSLFAEHDEDGIRRWFKRNIEARYKELRVSEQSIEFAVEPKIDGLTLRATYRNGSLVQAATRGDGQVGEDVTLAAHHIVGLPTRSNQPNHTHDSHMPNGAPPLPTDFTVRGEVYISKADFLRLNAARAEQGHPAFANARNAASGSLRLLNPDEVAQRSLRFIAYELLYPGGPHPPSQGARAEQPVTGDASPPASPNGNLELSRQKPGTHSDSIKLLKRLGFDSVLDELSVSEGLDAAIEATRKLQARREALSYEVDGCVIKLNDLQAQRELGAVGTDPCWAVAWKFPALSIETVLLDIELTVGRTGVIVPTAVLEPCKLGGVTVQRASLHNTGRVVDHGLRLGDTVRVERRGDVIPQVTAVLSHLRKGSEVGWQLPTHCPVCHNALQRRQPADGSPGAFIQFCNSPSCSAQQLRKLQYFADTCIKGLGAATVKLLLEQQLVSSPVEFYRLTLAQIQSLGGFKDKRARNVLNAINESKKGSKVTLLTGLGITGLGKQNADLLLRQFGSLQELARLDEGALEGVKGVGPVLAQRIAAWFRQEDNCLEAIELASLWDAAAESASQAAQRKPQATTAGEPDGEGPVPFLPLLEGFDLKGLRLVVSGSLAPPWTRGKVEEWAVQHGVTLQKSVSKSTQLVIACNQPGPEKLKKAESLGIEVRRLEDVADATPSKAEPPPPSSTPEPAIRLEPPAAAAEAAGERVAFAVCGRFGDLTHNDIRAWARAHGHTFHRDLQPSTQVLLVGARAQSGKQAKAKQANIAVQQVPALEQLPAWMQSLRTWQAGNTPQAPQPTATRAADGADAKPVSTPRKRVPKRRSAQSEIAPQVPEPVVVWGEVRMAPGDEFAVCGEIPGFTRAEIQRWSDDKGLRMNSRVTKRASVLVVGEDRKTGSAIPRAQALAQRYNKPCLDYRSSLSVSLQASTGSQA